MTVLNGHFDGRQVILDEPAPANLRPDTPVRIVIDEATTSNGEKYILDELAELTVADDDLPADYSEQHEHYVKGTPRK